MASRRRHDAVSVAEHLWSRVTAQPPTAAQVKLLDAALVLLATWRTSSWIGVDGLIGGYLQRRHDFSSTEPVVVRSVKGHAVAA